MISSLRYLILWCMGMFRSRQDLILENLALRQQLLALYNRRPRRRLSHMHKLFWVALRRLWSGWKGPLVLVTPRTVVAWHRAGFRLYWRWLSREHQTLYSWNQIAQALAEKSRNRVLQLTKWHAS